MQDEKQQPKNVKFKQEDLKVISILWAYELVDHWLVSLAAFTFLVTFSDVEREHHYLSYYEYADIWIFVGAMVGVLVIALMVDSYDHRHLVSIIGLSLCCTTPVWAVITCSTKIRAGLILIFLVLTGSFIVCPATYSLVFNQNLNPIRREVRLVVSFFEFVVCLFGKYLAFICLPNRPTNNHYVILLLVFVWIAVTPLLITFIAFVIRMKKHVTGDFIYERGLKQIFLGLRSDMRIQPPRRKGKSAIQVLFFILLLLPVLSITSLDAALSNADSDDEAKAQSPTLQHIKYSIQVIVIPLTELSMSLMPFKDTTCEILVLGVAHFVNIFVLSLFIVRLDSIIASPKSDSNRSGGDGLRSSVCLDPDDCTLPEPGPGHVTYIVMTSVSCTLTTEPQALFDSVPKTMDECSYILGEFYIPGNKSEMTFKFTYTLGSPGSGNPPSKYKNITIHEKKNYFYIISSDNSSHIDCIEVFDVEKVTPREYPQLILLSSLCNKEIEGIEVIPSDSVFRIESEDVGWDHSYPFSHCGNSRVLGLPFGVDIRISYKYRGSDPRLAEILTSDSATFVPKEFGVYLGFLLRNETNMILYLLLLRTAEPLTTTTDVTPISSVTMSTATSPVTMSTATSPVTMPTATSPVTMSTATSPVTETSSAGTTAPMETTTVTLLTTTPPGTTSTMPTVTETTGTASTMTASPEPETLTTTTYEPTTTEAPPEPKPPDAKQQTTYAMYGAALGITSVGYTHFFWVESPLRLRAFLYALFRVSIEVVRRITEGAVGHTFTRSQAIGLLMLQIFTTVWHIGLSWIFQTVVRFKEN